MSDPKSSWYHERESAWLYEVVARAEQDPNRRQLFESLGAAALEQATHWARLANPGEFQPRTRARLVARLIGIFGPRSLKPVLAAMKLRGLSVYGAAPVMPRMRLALDTRPSLSPNTAARRLLPPVTLR